MKAETLRMLAGIIGPLGTRPVTVHAITECKEIGGTKESWFTCQGNANGVKASEKGGYEYKGGAGYIERETHMTGHHKGNGQVYFLLSRDSITYSTRKDGTKKRHFRTLHRDASGKVCPPPPPPEKAKPANDWKERPYKVENIISIRYAGKLYR